jgi:DNA-binding MarR family transcriptional regulator
MFRQNTVLNDFVNFLKARGRFREIEFIDNSVIATPRIPDFPSIVFYIEETRTEPKEQHYVLEIHGNESSVMIREIQEFFSLNELEIQRIRVKYHLKTELEEELKIEVEGIKSPFETVTEQVLDLIDSNKLTVDKTQKTLIFGSKAIQKKTSSPRPSQVTTKSRPVIQPPTPTISPVKRIEKSPSSIQVSRVEKPSKLDTSVEKSHEPSLNAKNELDSTSSVDSTSIQDTSKLEEDHDDFDESKLFREPPGPSQTKETEDLEADLFRMEPPDRDYSEDVAPYLKQSSGLFRRDNWEEDLPTELEMEILERTYSRIKHRTKPEILAKDIGIHVEEAEGHLRNLISKGLLRTQVGWFIIKKSHLDFFKKTFADSSRKKKKKKSPRISRTGEGLTPEEIATIKAIKSRPNLKAQSNLLTRPTGLKQSILKEVLRNLVDKGILRVSYGWYILKDKHILEQKRGKITTTDSSKPSKPSMSIPKQFKLTDSEVQVIQALLQRPQFKAQSNLLTSEVKLSKDQIKQVLRNLVEKDICKVTYGWYALKDPNQFLKQK